LVLTNLSSASTGLQTHHQQVHLECDHPRHLASARTQPDRATPLQSSPVRTHQPSSTHHQTQLSPRVLRAPRASSTSSLRRSLQSLLSTQLGPNSSLGLLDPVQPTQQQHLSKQPPAVKTSPSSFSRLVSLSSTSIAVGKSRDTRISHMFLVRFST